MSAQNPSMIRCNVNESVDLEAVVKVVSEMDGLEVVLAQESGETNRKFVVLTHSPDLHDYLHDLRATGLFDDVEYVDPDDCCAC